MGPKKNTDRGKWFRWLTIKEELYIRSSIRNILVRSAYLSIFIPSVLYVLEHFFFHSVWMGENRIHDPSELSPSNSSPHTTGSHSKDAVPVDRFWCISYISFNCTNGFQLNAGQFDSCMWNTLKVYVKDHSSGDSITVNKLLYSRQSCCLSTMPVPSESIPSTMHLNYKYN